MIKSKWSIAGALVLSFCVGECAPVARAQAQQSQQKKDIPEIPEGALAPDNLANIF